VENKENQAKLIRRKRNKITKGKFHAERLMVMTMKEETEIVTKEKKKKKKCV